MSDQPELPRTWTRAPLTDLCHVNMGQSPPSTSYNKNGDGLPFFQGKAEFTDLTPVARVWCNAPGKIALPGDILVSIRAPVGPTNLAGERCCIGRGLAALSPRQGVESRFILYAMRHRASHLDRLGTGTTFKAVSGKTVSQFMLAIAPTREQRRIVAKIEELFSDLDAGVAALERVRANLKRYRAAVLKAAVEGSPNSPPPWKPIGEVIQDLEQGWSPKCESAPALEENEWAVMTTTAIQPLRFSSDENKRLPKGLTPRADLEVRVGDMVITRAGPRARAGVACLVRSTRKRLILCDKAYRFQCDEKQVRGAFLEIALNADPVLKNLDKMKTGISDSGVNLTQPRFRELLVPVPSLPVQDRIVAEVDRRLSVADAAETQVEHALQRAARLRQAILKRAFEGKLVPQNPTDEPASALLESIKARSNGKRSPPAKPATRRSRAHV